MDPVDNMAQPFTQHGRHAFIKGFAAAFIGAIIGAWLDNTRFGRWFNNSRIVTWVFRLLLLYGVYLAAVFAYEVIKVW